MRILAVDTSTDTLAICLAEGQMGAWTVRYNSQVIGQAQHGVTLLPTVIQALEHLAWPKESIEAIFLGIGPGSYTGLRIGVTFAKTWAVSLNIPIYQVSSLALLAAAYPPSIEEAGETLLLPLMDARRLSAYAGLYQYHSAILKTVMADCHSDWADFQSSLAESVEKMQVDKLVLIGEGLAEFLNITQDHFAETPVAVRAIESTVNWGLALNRLEPELVSDIDLLVPNYAHATLAEREWAAKQQTTLVDEEDNEKFIERI